MSMPVAQSLHSRRAPVPALHPEHVRSGNAVVVSLDFSLYASLNASPLGPLPEPAAYTTLCGGLAALAVAARRRKRKI
jgi:hypothetical protein